MEEVLGVEVELERGKRLELKATASPASSRGARARRARHLARLGMALARDKSSWRC